MIVTVIQYQGPEKQGKVTTGSILAVDISNPIGYDIVINA
jgi:hypothetical protein